MAFKAFMAFKNFIGYKDMEKFGTVFVCGPLFFI